MLKVKSESENPFIYFIDSANYTCRFYSNSGMGEDTSTVTPFGSLSNNRL